jgi:quinol monooxygenase YgiN
VIIRIVKLQLAPDKTGDFLRIFRDAKEKILNSPGCLDLKLLSDIEQNGTVFTYSHWENTHDLEMYRASDLFAETWKQVKPLFIEKAQAWTLNDN